MSHASATRPTLSYKESEKIRVPVNALQIGMRVCELDRPWEETPFLFQGFQIETEEEIRILNDLCEFVVVDVESRVDFRVKFSPEDSSFTPSTSIVRKQETVQKAFASAHKTYADSSRLVRGIMDDIRLGKSVDTPAAKEAIGSCVDNVISNPDALLLLTRIKNKDEYTAEHSLNVAILTIALGRQLGLNKDKLMEVGMCGMLHDVGKILTPADVLNKPGRLTREEMEEMKKHPVHGRDILLSSDGVFGSALDVAFGHHESLDGTGYPRGLTDNQLTMVTKMVAITDTFDAITSDRVYRNGSPVMDALQILNRNRGKRFDSKLVMRFVKAIGMFPPGSVVELSTGDFGVVVESHPVQKLRPKVLVLKTPLKQDREARIIDLAYVRTDEQGKELRIVKNIHPSDAGIDLQAVRDQGLISTAPLA
jgi:HD-GYP domain-containing protein (c-di-GMP phosphodiesterase class II)